jgi:hypothetical protein
MNKPTENTILKKALHQFNQITGGKAKQIQMPVPGVGMEADAALRITLGKVKHDLLVEIKHELRQPQLPVILTKLGRSNENWILVSKYIPQPIKTQLKEQNINYLETAGNCFIHAGGLFLYINDQPVTASRQTTTAKLWKQAGLKFLLVVISNPTLLNSTYRNIAEEADIALGNIGPLMQELAEAGYIKKEQDEWVLYNKETLIQRWVELFHALLKPKYQLGRFRFLKPSMEQRWKSIKPANFYWGGDPAGELLTNFLQPELFTIYTGNHAAAIKELQLVPDVSGNIELIAKFWNFIIPDGETTTLATVPPLLVYADLMASNDSRNWEVASRIKSKYLNG